MPECHRCEHSGRGRVNCLACAGPAETNHKGRSHVSLDAGGPQTLGEVDAVIHAATQQPAPTRMTVRQRDREAMVACLRQVFEMDPASFAIVRERFLSPETPLRVIAKRHRVTTQAVHRRLQQVAAEWPAVRDLVGLRLKRGVR